MSEKLQCSLLLNDLKSEIREREVQLARSDQTQKRLAWSLELYEKERNTKRQGDVVPLYSDRPCGYMSEFSFNHRDEFFPKPSTDIRLAFKTDLSPVLDHRTCLGNKQHVFESNSMICCSAGVSPSLAAGQFYTKHIALDSEKNFQGNDDFRTFASQKFGSVISRLEQTVARLDDDVKSIQDSLRPYLEHQRTKCNLSLYPIVLDLTSKCQALRRTLKTRHSSKISRSSEEQSGQSSPVKSRNPPNTLKLLRTIDAALRVTSFSPSGNRPISPKKDSQRNALFGEAESNTMQYRRSPPSARNLRIAVALKSHSGHTSDPSHVTGTEPEHCPLHTPRDRRGKAQESDEHSRHSFRWCSDPGPTRAWARAVEPVDSRTASPSAAAIPADLLLPIQEFLRDPQAVPTVDAAGAGAPADSAAGLVDSAPMPILKPYASLAEESAPTGSQHGDHTEPAKPDVAGRPVAAANASPPAGEKELAQHKGEGLSPERAQGPARAAACPAASFCDDLWAPSESRREPGGKDGPSAEFRGSSGAGRAIASLVAADSEILCHCPMESPIRATAGSPSPSIDAASCPGRQASPWPGSRDAGLSRVAAEGRRTLCAPPDVAGVGRLGLTGHQRGQPESVGPDSPGCGPKGAARRDATGSNGCASSPCSSHGRSECAGGGDSGGSGGVGPGFVAPMLAAAARLGVRCPEVLTAGPKTQMLRAASARLARPGWSMLCAASHSRCVRIRLVGRGGVKALGRPVIALADARRRSRRKRADPLLPEGQVGAGARADSQAQLQLRGLLLAAVGDGRVQHGKQRPVKCLDSSAGRRPVRIPYQPHHCDRERPFTVRAATWRGDQREVTDLLLRGAADFWEGHCGGGHDKARRAVEEFGAASTGPGRLTNQCKPPSLRVSRWRSGRVLSAKWGKIRRGWSCSDSVAAAERPADDFDGARNLASGTHGLSIDSTAHPNSLESCLRAISRASNQGLDLQRCICSYSLHALQAGLPQLSCDASTGASSGHAAVNALEQDGLQEHLEKKVSVGTGDGRDGEAQVYAVTMSQGQSVSLPGIVKASVQDQEMALLRAEIMRGNAERSALSMMVEQRDSDLEVARAHILSLSAEVEAKESEVQDAAAALVAAKKQLQVYTARGEWQSWTEHVDQWFG